MKALMSKYRSNMTNGQENFAIGVLGFIIVGTAFFIWGLGSGPSTPQEQYRRDYSMCLRSQLANHLDIDECNKIKAL